MKKQLQDVIGCNRDPYTSQHENDCRKTIFLYAGWRTHLLRFHGERPYHVRVESQVVVSLGASEIFFPLKVGAF